MIVPGPLWDLVFYWVIHGALPCSKKAPLIQRGWLGHGCDQNWNVIPPDVRHSAALLDQRLAPPLA